MKLSHKEVELLAKVIYRIVQRNYELNNVDKDLIAILRRLKQYHATTLLLASE